MILSRCYYKSSIFSEKYLKNFNFLFSPQARLFSSMDLLWLFTQSVISVIFNLSFLLYDLIREILYKGKDQIAWKQLWRPEGRQLSDMQQFILISVICILLNLLSCLPFGFQTGFSSFFEARWAFPCIRFPCVDPCMLRKVRVIVAKND